MHCTKIKTQLCVIGGGMSGICVAVAAARRGVKVVLIQDRNVLGGNASEEVRMWIRGAGYLFPEYREGGLIEELALDNIHYNPTMNFSVWEGVLYNKVISEKNITLFLGTSCIGATENDGEIKSIDAWELASYRKYRIYADYFADCSGDSILAEFTDAMIMQGRENVSQYGEDHAQQEPDAKTMGNSCILQLRKVVGEIPLHQPFPFEKELISEFCDKRVDFCKVDNTLHNFWWIELGGDKDALKDAGSINRELIATSFSVYTEYLKKNQNNKQKWVLDWIGFLAGKRETRRYVGDYVLCEQDIQNSQYFEDEIAYGGWSMDDHDPRGLYAESPNINYYFDKPYAIPYRCVYSKNVKNLFFAGRNISVTHMALSSTRVMATCSMIGQAVGEACALAVKYNESPRGVGKYIGELKQNLLQDDCYLLHTERKVSDTLMTSKSSLKENSLLRNAERNLNGEDAAIKTKIGERICFEFKEQFLKTIRIVFDSDFLRTKCKDPALKQFPMLCYNSGGQVVAEMPDTLVKDYVIEYRQNGVWHKFEVGGNFQRLRYHELNSKADAIAFTGLSTYGAGEIRFFTIDLI